MLLVTQKVGTVPIATCLTHEMAYEITSAMGLKPGETTVTEIPHLVTLEEVEGIRLDRILQSIPNEDDREFVNKLAKGQVLKAGKSTKVLIPFAVSYRDVRGSQKVQLIEGSNHNALTVGDISLHNFLNTVAVIGFLYKEPVLNEVPDFLFVPTDSKDSLLRKGFYELYSNKDTYTLRTRGGLEVYLESRKKVERDPPLVTGMQDDWVLLYRR